MYSKDKKILFEFMKQYFHHEIAIGDNDDQENEYNHTRSLGALWAPTLSLRPFGPLDLSFAPFGRSGQGTHASYIDYIRCFDYG